MPSNAYGVVNGTCKQRKRKAPLDATPSGANTQNNLIRIYPVESNKSSQITPYFVASDEKKFNILLKLDLPTALYSGIPAEYNGHEIVFIYAHDDGPEGARLIKELARAGALVRGLFLASLPNSADYNAWLFNGYDKNELLKQAEETPYCAAPVGVSEDALAWAFAGRHKGRLRYCHELASWFLWDGTRWRKEKTKMAFDLARDLCREFNIDGTPVLGKAATAGGVLQFAQADRAFVVDAEEWDTDRYLLGTPGGTVDLKSGRLLPAQQDYMITKSTAVAPANEADCPRWRQFLDEATQGDIELQHFMRQVAGYCLTGDVSEHALFFIYGPGGNGKSVFLNALNNILGDYGTTAAMTTFTASRSDQHPADLAMLRGARLVSVSETEEGRSWAESRIKQLTGGDKVSARFMRQDFFEYSPQFKLLIVGNHAPMLHCVDEAMKRRFNIIPFVHKPERPDHDLEAKLKAEYPAILRWAIEGCLDWKKNGLIRPESVQAATNEYFDVQDLFGQWLDECCEDKTGSGLYSTSRTLYESWASFAKSNGEEAGDIRKFTPMLTKRGYLADRKNKNRIILGLVLKFEGDCFTEYDN